MLAIQTTAPRKRRRAAPDHLPDLSTARSLVRDLLTDAERAAIHAARWRLMVAARAARKAG